MSARMVSPILVGRAPELERRAPCSTKPARVRRRAVAGEAGVGKTGWSRRPPGARRGGRRVLVGGCVELGGEGLPFAPVVEALRDARRVDAGRRARRGARAGAAPSWPGCCPSSTRRRRAAAARTRARRRSCSTRARPPRAPGGAPSAGAGPRGPALGRPLHAATWSPSWSATLRGVRVLLVARTAPTSCTAATRCGRSSPAGSAVRSVERVELERFGARRGGRAARGRSSARRPSRGCSTSSSSAPRATRSWSRSCSAPSRGADPADLPPSLRDVLLARAERLSAARSASCGPPRRPAAGSPTGCSPRSRGARRRRARRRAAGGGRAPPARRRRDRRGYALPARARRATRSTTTCCRASACGCTPRTARRSRPTRRWPAATAASRRRWRTTGTRAPTTCRARWPRPSRRRRPRRAYAPAEALRHLERALELWPQVPDAARALRHRPGRRAAARRRDGAYARRAGAVAWLLHEALAELSDERRAAFLGQRSKALVSLARPDAVATLEAALALLPADRPSRLRAALLAELADALLHTEDLLAGVEVADQAVAAAEADGVSPHDAMITPRRASRLHRSELFGGDRRLDGGAETGAGRTATTTRRPAPTSTRPTRSSCSAATTRRSRPHRPGWTCSVILG